MGSVGLLTPCLMNQSTTRLQNRLRTGSYQCWITVRSSGINGIGYIVSFKPINDTVTKTVYLPVLISAGSSCEATSLVWLSSVCSEPLCNGAMLLFVDNDDGTFLRNSWNE